MVAPPRPRRNRVAAASSLTNGCPPRMLRTRRRFPAPGWRVFVPKLVTTLKHYDRAQFSADVVAGVIVGVVALPLSIAFAVASGVAPAAGLYTAIVGGFLIAALGGSRVQIGGPTGAFVVIVYGVVQTHGLAGLQAATLMAGLILIVLGVTKLGSAIKFVPQPVVTGFTSGIALIIFTSQVKDLFGLRMGAVPANFFDKWPAFARQLDSVNWAAMAVAAATIAILILWPRVSRRVPAPFVALVATTVVVWLAQLPVETIGDRFGDLHMTLPAPTLPRISFATARELVGPAIAIALLGGIESLLSAVVADGMIGGKHRSNMELVAQGVANIASPIFGGIPATGAIARTATNIKNGGRTPVAGIVHSVTLLAIMLFFGSLASKIPFATLAGILVIVAYHMSEWRTFRAGLRAPRSDVVVLVITFALTVVVDLTIALEVGMVMSAFLFMRRMAEVTNVNVFAQELDDEMAAAADSDPNSLRRRHIPKGVEVYEINGPMFFGAAEKFKEAIAEVARRPKALILRMRAVPAIDATGINLVRDLHARCQRDGTLFLLSDVHAQPLVAMSRAGLMDEIGDDNIFGNLDDALDRARAELGLPAAIRPAGVGPTVARETPVDGTPAVRR